MTLRYFLMLLITVLPALSHASDRVALLIANEDYIQDDLDNPINDAELIAQKLRELDFTEEDVIVLKNADRVEMLEAISNFQQKATGADAAIFYYSGHGMQNDDRVNFLLPVDARINNESNIEAYGVNAYSIIDALNKAKPRISLVIFDACRDNPFFKVRGGNRNFEVTDYDTDSTLLVAYATQMGQYAQDGVAGTNSPYAIALAEQLEDAEQTPVLLMFDKVRQKVRHLTSNAQSPVIRGDVGYYERLISQSTIVTTRPVHNTSSSSSQTIDNFTVYSNGTAVDNNTNLMWGRCSIGSTWDGTTCIGEPDEYIWEDAFDAVDKLNKEAYAGYSDWRIPHIEELYSIIYCNIGYLDDDVNDMPTKQGGIKKVKSCNTSEWGSIPYKPPAINLDVFPNSLWWQYWSSSVDKSNSSAIWEGNFGGGFIQLVSKSGSRRIRPVRDVN